MLPAIIISWDTALSTTPQTPIGKASATTRIIIMELVSIGKNGEIMQLGKMCQGSRMINALYSSNYGTAPTSPQTVAEISPWGVQREMYHFLASVLFPLNRHLRNGALQTEKDVYISMTLKLRQLEESAFCFHSSPSRTNISQLCQQPTAIPTAGRPLQAFFWVGGAQIPEASSSACCVT